LVKRKESLDIVRDEINSIKEINKSLEIAVEEEHVIINFRNK